MKKKKVPKVAIVLIGVLVVLIATALVYLLMFTNKTITAKFSYVNNKTDSEFSIGSDILSVDTPILFRKVEMVQYHKDNDGNVKLVFSDEPIESFDGYDNPDFPSEIKSEIFYDNTTFNGNTLSLEAVNTIVKSGVGFIKLENLPTDAGNHLGLINHENSYVTASNDWKVGEIRVSFFYLDPSKAYSIKGKINNNVIEEIESFSISE